jgi:cytoskeletal protein RodZ
LVSTDGLSNSYSSDEDFCQIGRDYLEMIRSNGIKSVTDRLETDLDNISRQGSGDDITLGMILRQEALEKEKEEKNKTLVEDCFSDYQSSQSQLLSNYALESEDLPENDLVNDMEKKNNKLSAIAIVLVLFFGAVGISFGVWSWFLLNGINTRLNKLETSTKQIEEINRKIGELDTKIADLTAESANQSPNQKPAATKPSQQSDRPKPNQPQTTENPEATNTEP